MFIPAVTEHIFIQPVLNLLMVYLRVNTSLLTRGSFWG